MGKFVAILLVSLFLGTGAALAGGGDFDQPQQQMAPSKIVVNVPDNGNDWTVPIAVAIITAAGGIGAAYWSRRKGD